MASSSVNSPAWTRRASSAIAAIAAAWSSTNAPIAVVAVTRHDDADRQLRDPQGRLRPVERIAVVEERHGAVLDEVPGEQHGRIGDADDDVVIGVPATEVAELDAAIADIQGCRLREGPVGRVDHDLGQVGGDLRHLRGDPGPADIAGPLA